MSHPDYDFLRSIVEKLSPQVLLTQELVADCYKQCVPINADEPSGISDKWIDFYLKKLLEIPHDELLKAQNSRAKTHDLLHRILT